eukprot:RCo011228
MRAAGAQSSYVPRMGDWKCASCNNVNFASRVQCHRCNSSRVPGVEPTALLRPGDWLCSRCGNHNFARRDECKQCGLSHTASDAAAALGPSSATATPTPA